MGTNSQVLVVGGEGHNLNPLGGVLEELVLGVVATNGADADSTVVSGNSEPVSVAGNGTGALGVGIVGEGGGTSSLGLDASLGNLVALELSTVVEVPEDNLVIVTGGDNSGFRNVIESPNFTFVVRVHNLFSLVSIAADGVDGSVTGSNDESVLEAIDSADEGVELEGLEHGHASGVNLVDAAVLATGVKETVNPADGANETLLVEVVGVSAVTALPDVDLGVGTTGVANTIGVVGNAREGSHGVSSEKTLLLISGLGVPEVQMLATGGSELGGAGLGGEAHIVDLVGVSLGLLDEGTGGGIEHVQPMLIV